MSVTLSSGGMQEKGQLAMETWARRRRWIAKDKRRFAPLPFPEWVAAETPKTIWGRLNRKKPWTRKERKERKEKVQRKEKTRSHPLTCFRDFLTSLPLKLLSRMWGLSLGLWPLTVEPVSQGWKETISFPLHNGRRWGATYKGGPSPKLCIQFSASYLQK